MLRIAAKVSSMLALLFDRSGRDLAGFGGRARSKLDRRDETVWTHAQHRCLHPSHYRACQSPGLLRGSSVFWCRFVDGVFQKAFEVFTSAVRARLVPTPALYSPLLKGKGVFVATLLTGRCFRAATAVNKDLATAQKLVQQMDVLGRQWSVSISERAAGITKTKETYVAMVHTLACTQSRPKIRDLHRKRLSQNDRIVVCARFLSSFTVHSSRTRYYKRRSRMALQCRQHWSMACWKFTRGHYGCIAVRCNVCPPFSPPLQPKKPFGVCFRNMTSSLITSRS